jgi:hypothetical protein
MRMWGCEMLMFDGCFPLVTCPALGANIKSCCPFFMDKKNKQSTEQKEAREG